MYKFWYASPPSKFNLCRGGIALMEDTSTSDMPMPTLAEMNDNSSAGAASHPHSFSQVGVWEADILQRTVVGDSIRTLLSWSNCKYPQYFDRLRMCAPDRSPSDDPRPSIHKRTAPRRVPPPLAGEHLKKNSACGGLVFLLRVAFLKSPPVVVFFCFRISQPPAAAYCKPQIKKPAP